jgi:hypothetical protein
MKLDCDGFAPFGQTTKDYILTQRQYRVYGRNQAARTEDQFAALKRDEHSESGGPPGTQY